jgi:signal peptidase I
MIDSPRPPSLIRIAGRRLNTLLLGVLLIVALWLAGSSRIGFHRYVITGKSMTGSIDIGSMVYDKVVPTSTLKVGDVITYVPPKSSGVHHLVTHRIIWIGRDSRGRLGFRTKGDHNPQADPWNNFTLGPSQAKVVFRVPYVGYALAELSKPQARMFLIGLPALLIALAVLAGVWEEAGREAKREGALEGTT